MKDHDLKFFQPVYQRAFAEWNERGCQVFSLNLNGKIKGFEVRKGTLKISYRKFDEQIVLEQPEYIDEVRNMIGEPPERIIEQVNEWLALEGTA